MIEIVQGQCLAHNEVSEMCLLKLQLPGWEGRPVQEEDVLNHSVGGELRRLTLGKLGISVYEADIAHRPQRSESSHLLHLQVAENQLRNTQGSDPMS